MSHSTPEMKTCKKCHDELPATSEFWYRDKNTKDSLTYVCKACAKKQSKSYRENNPDIAARAKRSWDERNRAKKLDSARKYRENNKAKVAKINKKYRLANIEKYNQNRKKWRANNPQKYKESNQINDNRRRARKRNLPDTFTHQDWLDCLEYFNYTCAVCGSQLRDLFGNVEPHADHWIPLSSELCTGTIPQNMVCLCNACNRQKWAKMPQDWLKEKYGTKKASAILFRVETYFASLKK